MAGAAASAATTTVLYLPNVEMTLDFEANEDEVKVLTSLASVAESTGTKSGPTSSTISPRLKMSHQLIVAMLRDLTLAKQSHRWAWTDTMARTNV